MPLEAGQDNTVAIVAIAVSGGVALAVAVLAAVTSHYRQKDALKHDRKMRGWDDCGRALDTALTNSYAWVGGLARVQSYWKDGRNLDEPEVKTLVLEANASIQGMYAAGALLDLRFGEDSAISRAFEEMLNTVKSLAQALRPYSAGHPYSDHVTTISATQDEANQALKKFVEEAKSWRDAP